MRPATADDRHGANPPAVNSAILRIVIDAMYLSCREAGTHRRERPTGNSIRSGSAPLRAPAGRIGSVDRRGRLGTRTAARHRRGGAVRDRVRPGTGDVL